MSLDAAEWVWIEAEPPNGEANAALSGGQMSWAAPGAVIEKSFVGASEGTYTFWLRKFWNGQRFRWRTSPTTVWQTNDVAGRPLTDLVSLGGNGRMVGWMQVGDTKIPAGSTTFRMEIIDEKNTTAYDCFLFTKEPFTPRGKAKPGELLEAKESGWFSFQPRNDSFEESPIDLRRLNEKEAGVGGVIAGRGAEFVHSKTGEPVRFWGVNTGVETARRSKGEVDLFARTLAKHGVNLVRIHGAFYSGAGRNFGEVNAADIAGIQYLVTALKREGIYSYLSIYFPLWVTLKEENAQFPGYTGQHPFGLLYFNEPFQAIYRNWWKALLTTANPHTGVPLRDEPAVAIAEMINEDSLFFWTFNPDAAKSNIPEPQRAILEEKFGEWLLKLYPGRTLAEIRNSIWSGVSSGQDNFADGRVGFRALYTMFNERKKRDQDTARFLAEVQLEFYSATYKYLRETLGFKGVISASNWTTASPQYFGPLDKWSNASADLMDRHGYFGGMHTGDAASYSVRAGQRYNDRSALKFEKENGAGEDFNNPLFDTAYAGKPSIISEVNWPQPNRYRADFPFLAAALGASQGSDAIIDFAAGAATWESVPAKFTTQTPVSMGQFPAAALIFRQHLVDEAPEVVKLSLAVTNLFALGGAPLPSSQNFDQLRGKDVPPGGTITNASALAALSFVAGRVAVEFGTNGASQIRDLSPYVDRTNKTARSVTGEFAWDWRNGVAQLRAARAQGVTGHLVSLGNFDLPDVAIGSVMEFGSILLVPLDGQPLGTSSKMLLQVMSEEKPFGWATDAAIGPRTITNAGQPPVMVREFAGNVRLKRGNAATLNVTALDFNGYRSGARTNHAAGITLARDVLYYLIEK